MGEFKNFTVNDFRILKAILTRDDNKKGLTLSTGTTISEIVEKTNLSSKKVRDTIKKLLELGYICEGLKNVRTKTYVMTEEGFIIIKKINSNIFGEVQNYE